MGLFDRLEATSEIKEMAENGDVQGLIDALNDDNPNIRKHAASKLGELKDSEAVEPLIKALKDEKTRVRKKAAKSLGLIGDNRAVDPLIDALEDDNISVFKKSVKALAEIGDNRAVPVIMDYVANDRFGSSDAIKALGAFRDKRTVEPLINQLKDGPHKSSIVQALGDIGDERAVEPIIDEIHNSFDLKYKNKAALALGKIGDGRAINPIIEAAVDANIDLFEAGFSLKMIGKLEPSSKAQNYYDQVLNGLDESHFSIHILPSKRDLLLPGFMGENQLIDKKDNLIVPCYILSEDLILDYVVMWASKEYFFLFKEFSSVNYKDLRKFWKASLDKVLDQKVVTGMKENFFAVAVVDGIDSETKDDVIRKKRSTIVYDLQTNQLHYSKKYNSFSTRKKLKMIEKYLTPSPELIQKNSIICDDYENEAIQKEENINEFICKECNTEYNEGANFCKNCGNKL